MTTIRVTRHYLWWKVECNTRRTAYFPTQYMAIQHAWLLSDSEKYRWGNQVVVVFPFSTHKLSDYRRNW